MEIRLKIIAIVFGMIAVFASDTLGQNANTGRDIENFQTFKYAEIGELPREKWEQELARFVDTTKTYLGSRGEIFVYAETGSSRTSINPIREQFRNFLKKYAGDSLTVWVDPGGYRARFTAELWIVNKGDSPKATPDIPFQPEQIGEIGDVSRKEFERLIVESWNKLLDEPSDQGYIINYGSEKEIARREKLITETVSFRHDDRSRITFVRGGDKYPGSGLTILYSIPPGAAYPNL